MADGGGARRTGLGRGLQSLLPEAGEQPPAPDAADWFTGAPAAVPARLPGVVETGLALLRQALGVDVSAYLHAPGHGRPRMWLPSEPGSALGPRDWSELGLTAAGLVLTGLRAPRSLELGGMEVLAIPSRGQTSSGIHLVGRSGRTLDDRERSVAIHLVQALGEALHGLGPDDEHEPGPAEEAPVAAGAAGPDDPPAPQRAVVVRWPGDDVGRLEKVVLDAVRASGIRHSELLVRRVTEGGADVLDVSAAHRGDRVRVVVPAEGGDPASAAARAGVQAARMLELIGVPPARGDRDAHRVADVPA